MLYMLINRTRQDLSAEEYEQLGRLAQGFYDRIPFSAAPCQPTRGAYPIRLWSTQREAGIEDDFDAVRSRRVRRFTRSKLLFNRSVPGIQGRTSRS